MSFQNPFEGEFFEGQKVKFTFGYYKGVKAIITKSTRYTNYHLNEDVLFVYGIRLIDEIPLIGGPEFTSIMAYDLKPITNE